MTSALPEITFNSVVAAEGSWLNSQFQENELTKEERSVIIRQIMMQYKSDKQCLKDLNTYFDRYKRLPKNNG